MREQNCICPMSYYKNKLQLKLESQTTNQLHYKGHQLEKQQAIEPPKIIQKHYDPTLLQTSYKSTYTKPVGTQQKADNNSDLINSYMKNKPKNVPFYSETEYKKNFQQSQIRIEPVAKYEYKPKNTKFEGESSYKAQFTGQPNSNVDLNRGNDQGLMKEYLAKKPKVAFEGKSSYKDTFVDYGVKHEKQAEYKYQPKNTKFEGESSYKSTFKEMPKEAYKNHNEFCPVHPDKIAIK